MGSQSRPVLTVPVTGQSLRGRSGQGRRIQESQATLSLSSAGFGNRPPGPLTEQTGKLRSHREAGNGQAGPRGRTFGSKVTACHARVCMCVYACEGVQGWGGECRGAAFALSSRDMGACLCTATNSRKSLRAGRGGVGHSLWAWPAAEAFLAPACWMSALSLSWEPPSWPTSTTCTCGSAVFHFTTYLGPRGARLLISSWPLPGTEDTALESPLHPPQGQPGAAPPHVSSARHLAAQHSPRPSRAGGAGSGGGASIGVPRPAPEAHAHPEPRNPYLWLAGLRKKTRRVIIVTEQFLQVLSPPAAAGLGQVRAEGYHMESFLPRPDASLPSPPIPTTALLGSLPYFRKGY